MSRLSSLLSRAAEAMRCWRSIGTYEIKDMLLRRYGERDGWDVQRIVDACWGCEGCDEFHRVSRDGFNCGGTGVYRLRWVLLERWLVDGRAFHRPVRSVNILWPSAASIAAVPILFTPEELASWRTPRVIEGIVSYRQNYEDSVAALLELAFLFDPAAFALLTARAYPWNPWSGLSEPSWWPSFRLLPAPARPDAIDRRLAAILDDDWHSYSCEDFR